MNFLPGSYTFLLLVPFFLFSPQLLKAQAPAADLALIMDHMNAPEDHKKKITTQVSVNPVKTFFYISLFFYQKFLSQQISAVCEFDRSCSNFGLHSIKEFGLVKGVCLTADRLTRCNGLAQSETENYLIDHATGKIIDEPSMYRFKN
jgi:uncharacterized protein